MCKENTVTTIRMPEKLTKLVDGFAEMHGMSRTSAINYLLTKGLIYENGLENVSDRIAEINKGKSRLVERDLIDD